MLNFFAFLVLMFISTYLKNLEGSYIIRVINASSLIIVMKLKGYKFYDPQNMNLLISCDVIFDEIVLLQVSRTIQGGEIKK
jgi:hypothetical protein